VTLHGPRLRIPVALCQARLAAVARGFRTIPSESDDVLAKDNLWENRQGQLVLGVTVKGRGRSQQKIDVPIGKAVAERLLALLRHREAGPKDPLLVNQSGHRYLRTVLSDVIARRARQAGIARIPVRAHTLRHTYNVVARSEAGLDEVQRAGLLNQTDTASVRRYDHLLPDETHDARERVRVGLQRYVGE
jgi:integrase